MFHTTLQSCKNSTEKLSDVLTTFSGRLFDELLCYVLNKSPVVRIRSHTTPNRLKPFALLSLSSLTLLQLLQEVHLKTTGSPRIYHFLIKKEKSINNFVPLDSKSIAQDTERIGFSARQFSESFPTW